MRVLLKGSTGADVKTLQRALNARSEDRGFVTVDVDGVVGNETFVATRRVGRALGCLERTLQGDDIPIGLQRMIITPALRTPVQLVRARDRKRQREAERKRRAAERPTVVGNKVAGGSGGRARIVAGARRAKELDDRGIRKSFYSQPGRWTCDHVITGEERGERSDCSQFGTGLHYSAGCHDPNANNYKGGYTGSMAEHMHEVSFAEAEPGDTIIWDAFGPQGHTATLVFKGRFERTSLCIGHGSAHVAQHAVSDFSYKGRARYFRGSST